MLTIKVVIGMFAKLGKRVGRKQTARRTMMASAVIAASVCANAADLNIAYFPITTTGPWDWTVTDAWIKNWPDSSGVWQHTKLGSLPSYNPSGNSHSAYLYHNKLADTPLVLSSGTSASIYGLLLGGGPNEEPGIGTTKPILFEIDGGSLTVNSVSYIGYYHTNLDGGAHTATRSGNIALKNGGTLTAKGVFNLGYGFADSVLDIQNGTFTASTNLNIGGGWQARGILTNGVNGVVNAKEIYLTADSYTTGIVYNAGTINAESVWLGNKGGKAYSRFDNCGTLNVTEHLRLGCNQYAGESVYVHHNGATLTKNNENAYYIGYNGPGRFVIDGGTYEDKTTKTRFYIGFRGAGTYTGHGVMEVINGATFYNKERVALGYANCGEGSLIISNRSTFTVGNCVHIGNAPIIWSQTDGCGSILVDDHSVFSPGALRVGDSTRAYGEMTVSGGSSVIAPYTSGYLYIGASATGYSTGVVTVVGSDAMISNYWNVCVGTVADRNNGTLNLKGGTIVCRADNVDSLHLGFYTNTTTTVENRSVAKIRGYGTIKRADNNGKCAYMSTHYGKIIADGEGSERDLDMHTMCSLSKTSTNAWENVNFSGEDGWYAVNKGRLRLPHGEIVKDYRMRGIGDFIWLNASDSRLVNSIKFMFDEQSRTDEGNFYVHADLYAADRSDIPAGLTDRFGQDEITAVYRMGCFDGIEDTSRGHKIVWPTIRFHYAKPNYQGYENRSVKLYWYNEATSKWQIENSLAFDADYPYIQSPKTSAGPYHPAESGKAWNIGWYAIVVPKIRPTIMIIK